MYTLFGLKSSSDRLSLHMGNFDYLDDKNLFLVPLFCAAKVGVILEWCFVSEASKTFNASLLRFTIRSIPRS